MLKLCHEFCAKDIVKITNAIQARDKKRIKLCKKIKDALKIHEIHCECLCNCIDEIREVINKEEK